MKVSMEILPLESLLVSTKLSRHIVKLAHYFILNTNLENELSRFRVCVWIRN
jgi:hypothetical protein